MPQIFAFWTRKKESNEEEKKHIAFAEDSDRHVEEILYPASEQREIIELSNDNTLKEKKEETARHSQEQKNPKEWMFPNAQRETISKILKSRKKTADS